VQLDHHAVVVPEHRDGAALCDRQPGRSGGVFALEIVDVLQVVHIPLGRDVCRSDIDDRNPGEFERVFLKAPLPQTYPTPAATDPPVRSTVPTG
jgi:hypothetical protein